MAKKYNSSKKQNGEQKTTALSNMYDKLMAYAKVIEGSDWKMGWASTQRTWNGFPQNISGRQYTGGNSFYLMMATMANNHTVPIYATFNQIQKMNQHLMDEKGRIPKEKWAEAVHVRKGEQSEIVVFNTPLYVNPDNPKEKPLTTKDYEQLSKEEKEKYNQIWTHVPHVIFNIDQTNMKEVRPELYEKLVERMMPKQKQTFRQDTMGMYEEPAIDYILKNQTWRCPIVFDKESKDAFYRPSTDTITVPMKEQYNIPYTEKELDNDINKFITPALSMKAVITDFSDADRQMQRVTEKKDNKEYLAELRATIMLENTFGKQLGMLRQDGQSINDYAKQISSAITNDREKVITIKDAEAKIIGGQDYYTTFLHEGAHSMHKELNIELNATGDKRGYAREEMRVESSTAMVSAALGYSTNMFINSAAYVRGWNETANIQEKTKQMQQLISDINKTVNRMGEIIDDARIKVGEEPVFKRSNSAEQNVEQQPDKQTVESVAVSSTHTPEQSSHKDTEVAATPMTYTLLLEQMMKQAKVHSLGLPDGVKIDYDNDGLTVDKYKEGVKHTEFANLPKNEQDSLGWSATEILLETLQNTLKRYAEKTTTDLTVNLPNGDTVSLNKGNLDETYNHLSKLEKIGVLNAFASAAEADAELLFDNALKNTKDNKIFLEPNNWIQKDDDGNLSIVLVKDNETKKSSLNDLNGLTQWYIVSFAVEENAQKIKQAKDAQAVPYPEQQTSPSDKVAETPAADQQASVAKSPDQQIQQQTEQTWNKLSALLMDTNEDIHFKAKEDALLVLETDEDQGLSDLEKNHLSEVWQHPTEGIITFKIEGYNQELDLSEFPEFIPQVYNHVLEGNMETISVKQQLEDKLISLSELAAQTQKNSPEMEDSLTPKEYTTMWMTSIAEKTPKDRPSDIVFIKDFNLDDTSKPIYTAYGKDADRLAEKISSSVATMRPEIEGKRYPYADVSGSKIEAVRIDLMTNNVHPVIIDLEGNRITNDTKLDYTKEERKAFLNSLKPDAKQRQDIAETIQRLGSPDSIAVPQLYNSHSVYAGPELAVPHRFGYQEVPVLQLLKSKNGSYRAGNDEDGYFPIAKMDTNNLYEVQKALKIVENNGPQKLIEELQKQVESGKASVEKDLAENHYKFTIYDQQGDLYYPRGNKSFTLNTKENDKIYLHPDNANYVTEHKVDPQLIKQLTGYAETKMGIQHTQSPFHKIDDFFIRNVNGEWRLSANIDGKKMPEVTAAHNDVVEYKHGRISKEEISIKTYGDLLNNKQEQSHNRRRGLH